MIDLIFKWTRFEIECNYLLMGSVLYIRKFSRYLYNASKIKLIKTLKLI